MNGLLTRLQHRFTEGELHEGVVVGEFQGEDSDVN